MSTIYHHKSAPLTVNGSASSQASVCMFHDGAVIVSIYTAYGAHNTSLNMDAASLRAFAALLNEAVDALPVEEVAA